MKTEKKFPEIQSAEYPRDTAVRKMVQEVPVVFVTETVGDVLKTLKLKSNEFRTINYVYVVDEDFHLVGTFSIRQLFSRKADEEVYTFARMKNIITVRPDTDQEKVAYLALKHNIKAIPVVGKKRLFLGVVPNDAILSVVYKEMKEDIFHFAGIEGETDHGEATMIEVPLFRSFKQRIGWLVIGSLGGIFAAQFIGSFQNTLEKHVLLAAFLPVILYINNAVGVQIQTLTIRDFAVSDNINFRKYFFRHAGVVAIIAGFFSLLFFMIGLVFFHHLEIAQVLLTAIFVGILSSLITSLIVPMLLRKYGSDPAHAGGPLAAGMQDLLSIIIYFTVAALIL